MTAPEVWVVTYYVAQSDTWQMQGVTGRDECRSVIFRLTSQWPAVQHVSAMLQTTSQRELPKTSRQHTSEEVRERMERIVAENPEDFGPGTNPLEEWPGLLGPAEETEEEFLSRWRKEMRDAM